MPNTVPTPLLAFALQRYEADVGIMVTASHNPPADNGYKVYLGASCVEPDDAAGAFTQITSPTDQRIAQYIQVLNKSDTLPPLASNGWVFVRVSTVTVYVTTVRHLLDAL